MMSWSMLLLGILLMTAAIQDSVEQQKEEEEIHNIVAAGRGPPMNVAVMPVLANALNVSWEPPEEEPWYYMVDIGLNNEVTYNTFYLQEGLQGCTNYSITVTSVYADTCEDCAAHTQGTTGISVPPPPQKCWFDVTDTTSIIAYWRDPSIQCSIINHNISWWSHVLWNDEEGSGNAHATGTHYLIRNLQPYTNVTVSVAAATDIGYGPPTTCWNVTLQDKPGAPVLTNVTSQDHLLTVSWTPPEQVKGEIIQYSINFENNNSNISENVTGNINEESFSNIPVCEVYNVTVVASTEAGWGPPSASSSVMHVGTVPPSSVTCGIEEGSNEPRVCWTPCPKECLDDPWTHYSIRWEADILWSNGTDDGSYLLPWSDDLPLCYPLVTSVPYTNYSLCVGVDGQVTPAACCSVLTPQADPGPPVILEVTASVGSVVVTWMPPDEVNGIITEYMINAGSEENSVSTSVAGTVLTSVVDLQDGQTYDITVQARTEAGWGPKSEVWSITVCDTFPPAPELCWFSNITDNKMVITWIDPFVQCVKNHSISWAWDVLWSDEQGSNVTFSQDTSITLTDLPPYTNVTAQVAAAAAGGFGPPTSCWNVTSPDKMSGTKAMPDVVVMEEQLTQTDITKPESPEHDKCETDVHTAP